MIEVVKEGVFEVVTPVIVPMSRVGHSSSTCHKVTCIECRHQFYSRQVTWTPDGYVCGSCRNDE